MGVIMTFSLGFVPEGLWGTAILFYVLAILGFSGGNIFYDSLLMTVADKERMDFVSALGYALGYLGGGILFTLNVLMVLYPHVFDLQNTTEAIQMSFITVAIWWAVFSIPLFLLVGEQGGREHVAGRKTFFDGLQQLISTLREIRKYRQIVLFLASYWLYIDGADTIILMAVDYGMSLGLDSMGLIKALLITQFVGFPAAIAFGKIGEKTGTKTGILTGISVYVLITFYAFFMKHQHDFYLLAVAVGLVQGGVQSLSRSFYAKLIPEKHAGEFFGFYNMLGKFAAIIGPFLMGCVSVTTGNPRYSVFAVIALFISGGTILYFVKEK